MVIIKCGLNSDPHYDLPFVACFPRNRYKIINNGLLRVTLIKYKGYSPHVLRKSRPILIKKLNKLNYFQELADRLHNPVIFDRRFLLEQYCYLFHQVHLIYY